MHPPYASWKARQSRGEMPLRLLWKRAGGRAAFYPCRSGSSPIAVLATLKLPQSSGLMEYRKRRWPAPGDRTGGEMAVVSLQKQPARAAGDSSRRAVGRSCRLAPRSRDGGPPVAAACLGPGYEASSLHPTTAPTDPERRRCRSIPKTSNTTIRQAFRCSRGFIARKGRPRSRRCWKCMAAPGRRATGSTMLRSPNTWRPTASPCCRSTSACRRRRATPIRWRT